MDAGELDRLVPSEAYVAGHCVFGNQLFWSGFLDFAEDTLGRARAAVGPSMLALLDSAKADPRGRHLGSTYWNLLVERQVSVFLLGAGSPLVARKIPLPACEAKLNSHHRRLREMKDVAHRTRSVWMYSCWLHYRNIYLLQVAGRPWCETYLPAISAAEPRMERTSS